MAGGYYYDIFNTAIYSALDRFDVVSSVLVRSLLSISMLAGISRASFKLHESFFRRDFLGDLELTLAARYQPSRGNGDFDRISSVESLAVEIWMLRARRPMLKTASDEVKSDPVIQNYINDIDIYCEGLIPADHLRSFVLTEADRSIPRTLRLVCLASIFLLNMIFMPVIAAAVVMVIKISTESDVF